MTRLHHPNIVQFLGFIDNPFSNCNGVYSKW